MILIRTGNPVIKVPDQLLMIPSKTGNPVIKVPD